MLFCSECAYIGFVVAKRMAKVFTGVEKNSDFWSSIDFIMCVLFFSTISTNTISRLRLGHSKPIVS